MKNWPAVQKARPVIRMPEIRPSHHSRVDRPLEERPDHPPHADDQEQEAEHVGQAGERVAGLTKQTTAETRNRTPNSAGTQRCSTASVARAKFCDAGEQEHEADEDADGGDRRVVELQDDQRDDEPGDPGDEPDPPVAGDLARPLAQP